MISKKKLYLLQTIPFFLLILLNTSAYAVYQTNLLPGEYIQDGSSDLIAALEAVPFVYDWDNDGGKDLLVGFDDHLITPFGYVRFYKNQNTDNDPVFNGYTLVQAGGGDLTVPTGGS